MQVQKLKRFYRGLSLASEEGTSLIALMIGAGILGIALTMISQYYLQAKLQAKILNSEADLNAHTAILLTQALTANCSRLEALHATFVPTISQPTLIKERNDLSRGESSNLFAIVRDPTAPKKALSLSSPPENQSGYSVKKLSMFQKSNILGKSPPRVLAELVVEGIHRNSKKNWQFRIPLVLDLTAGGQIDDCLRDPDVKQMCNERGGTFIDDDFERPCAL